MSAPANAEWQLVPKKLTDEMEEAAAHAADGPLISYQEHWDAMLAAAPASPAPANAEGWVLRDDTWMLYWGSICVGQVIETAHGIYASFLRPDLKFAMAHRDPVSIDEGKVAVERSLRAVAPAALKALDAKKQK